MSSVIRFHQRGVFFLARLKSHYRGHGHSDFRLSEMNDIISLVRLASNDREQQVKSILNELYASMPTDQARKLKLLTSAA